MMSLLKNKIIKSLTVLTLLLTTLLTTTSAMPVYASSGDNSTATQATINFMQAESQNLTTKAQPGNFNVTLNGSPVKLSSPILVDQGATLLPVRAIGELLGIDISYDNNAKVAIATDEDTVLEIPIGYSFGVKNGEKVDIPLTRSILYNSSTYLPLRYMAEQLDINIEYISSTRTIAITTNGAATTSPTSLPTASVRTTEPDSEGTIIPPEETITTIAPDAEAVLNPSELVGGGDGYLVSNPDGSTTVYLDENTPQKVFDRNGKSSEMNKDCFKSFTSADEVKAVLPYLNDKGVNYTLENTKYVVVNMDINSQMVNFSGVTHVLCTDFISLQYSDKMIRLKDGTYTTDCTLPKGKTLKDISYFTYTENDGNVLIIVKVGNVDLSSFKM